MPEQQTMETTQEKQFIGDGFKVSDIDGDERTVTAIISTDAIDRDAEVILPKGLDFERFLKNPVVLWSHNSSLPPIGKALWVKRQGKKIIAMVKFAQTELAEEVFQLFKGGFLKAFSIGFMPTVQGHTPTPAEIRKRPELAEARRIFSETELLEFSAVGVPANPEALATAVKAGQFQLVAKDFDLREKFVDPVSLLSDETFTELKEKIDEHEQEDIFELKAKEFSIRSHVQMKQHIPLSPIAMVKHANTETMKRHKGQVY